MSQTLLFITPPFTQLNTPYPATAYLKGFFNTQNIESHQADLGMEVILELFSSSGLKTLFRSIEQYDLDLSDNSVRMLHLQVHYIACIDPVIEFLQDKNPTLAYRIVEGDYLPQAYRFSFLEKGEKAFGSMGIRDKARHYATLFLEDIGDLIRETVDPNFGFSRYAEQIGMSANTFDELDEELQLEPSFVDHYLLRQLEQHIQEVQPTLVCISVPFPGNLYGAFKCAQYIKTHYPEMKTSLGGGFPNTELRSLSDPRVFEYFDFVTLDDGERPLLNIVKYLDGELQADRLKRTFVCENDEVVYINNDAEQDFAFKDLGCPDYTGLDLKSYLSVLELANPMHRLWSDGCWNKLTMAHGCYWKKCSFCDISLDYIDSYKPLSAALLCDRVEQLIDQTGQNGFHFVDEAAPPSVMRDFAIEVLRRDLQIVWWTNIRFEESFSKDLCQLLRASGCIAVSGGLEVASDRLLEKMEKGVSVEQVARVAKSFTDSGIMVHAYLMYGFPTQSDQETIDSLEMVRQMFEANVLQSGFWHQFAMTAHSPVGLDPEKYGVEQVGPEKGGFAYNDLVHEDPLGADHALYSEGLKNSLFSYMHQSDFDKPLSSWFDFDTPSTSVDPGFIQKALEQEKVKTLDKKSRVLWLGEMPAGEVEGKKAYFEFHSTTSSFTIELKASLADTLFELLETVSVKSGKARTVAQLAKEGVLLDQLQATEAWSTLRENGLLIL